MISKYLDAFPFMQTYITEDSKTALYLKIEDSATKLHMLNLEESQNYGDGKAICDEDFSKRSFGHYFLDDKSDLLYITSDENNLENYNLYTINIKTGEFKQVTHTSYCGVYGFSEDHSKLVFGDRYKTEDGKFYTKLFIRDMATGEETLLADDADWTYRFSWSGVRFDADMKSVFVGVDKENLRAKSNFIKIDLASKEITKILPEETECNAMFMTARYVSGNDFFYCSNIDGYENIYHFDLESKVTSKLTSYENDLAGIRPRKDNKTIHVALSVQSKDETHFKEIVLNGSEKPSEKTHTLKGAHNIGNSEALWLSCSTMDMPLTFTKYEFDGDLKESFTVEAFVGKREELVHNSYRYVEYETFDGHNVPAFLSMPKGEIKAAVITAFYGGTNYYSWLTQLFSELGIAVLSPGVRGSWSYGKEWREHILGDLGGDEILDVHWGAKYLEKELGLKPSQIGVRGGSHGGYSVLRSMTMPEKFKDREGTSYPYGFGICWAGFADLEDFYKTSNIPDWLVNMLGAYEGNEEKYRERSPIHDFDNLDAPLFIAHGENDARVSPTSMQGFLDKLEGSNKDYIIHLMKGLGHGVGNKDDEIAQYTKMVSFLNRVLD